MSCPTPDRSQIVPSFLHIATHLFAVYNSKDFCFSSRLVDNGECMVLSCSTSHHHISNQALIHAEVPQS